MIYRLALLDATASALNKLARGQRARSRCDEKDATPKCRKDRKEHLWIRHALARTSVGDRALRRLVRAARAVISFWALVNLRRSRAVPKGRSSIQ